MTALKLVGHNIRRVGYPEVMGDVVPHWRECMSNFVPRPAVSVRYVSAMQQYCFDLVFFYTMPMLFDVPPFNGISAIQHKHLNTL